MSHPNPHHDPENVYPHDEYSGGESLHKSVKDFKKGMKGVRAPLHRFMKHSRRERHENAKKLAIAKKMK